MVGRKEPNALDQRRFDQWTMLLGQSENRRLFLERAVSGIAASTLAAIGIMATETEDAEASACRKKCEKKNSRAARRRCRKKCTSTPDTPGAGRPCKKNSNCRSAQICSGGVCTGGGACRHNGDCTVPQVCVGGTCKGGRHCSGSADCINAQRCINGLCVGGGICTDSLQCTAGQACQASECSGPPPIPCTPGEYCGNGMVCINGYCAVPPTCPSGQENCGPSYGCCPPDKCVPGDNGNFFCDWCAVGEPCGVNYVCCTGPCLPNDDGMPTCFPPAVVCPDGRPICGGTTCCAIGFGCARLRDGDVCV